MTTGIIWGVWSLFVIVGTAFLAYYWRRIGAVSKYRGELLEIISDRCLVDINLRKEWRWRYDEYEKVSFEDMMRQLWKPLDSFYKDKSFLELPELED